MKRLERRTGMPSGAGSNAGSGQCCAVTLQASVRIFRAVGVLLAVLLQGPVAMAHGGVTLEDDLCVIRISYLRAHFKIYQPLIGKHQQYCEDLPEATESVFVMEYLHDSLRETSIDFRIIRDVTGKGRFARWEDVQEIDNLDAVTVFHQPASIDPDVFSVLHDFEEEGAYIGIVTAVSPGSTAPQTAVFPFEVGFTGFGYWPLIIAVLVLIQLQYFVMGGWLRRRRQPRKPKLTVVKGGLDAK